MGKEAKGFNLVECHIKDAMIGEECANPFPLVSPLSRM
jgi:hypothetical protein